jgi:hypothetical protein
MRSILKFATVGVFVSGCSAVLGLGENYTVALGQSEAGVPVGKDSAVSDALLIQDVSQMQDVDPPGPSDANADVQIRDSGKDAAPTPDAGACTNGMYLCNGACVVADCAACPGAPIECMSCPTSAPNGLRVCVAKFGGCVLNQAYDHCSCTTTSDCRSNGQVCVNMQCRTCGETMTNGLVCKGTAKCNVGDGNCN